MHLLKANYSMLCLVPAILVSLNAQTLLPPAVDSQLQPGPEHKMVRALLAVGEQAYKCQAQAAGGVSWGPSSIPSATLLEPWNYKIGDHGHNGKSPFWKLSSGGEITASLVKSVTAPDKQSINWLLLKAESATGGFDGVKFIQRVYTGGGAAPKTGCDAGAAAANKVVKVGYTATYFFWK